MPTISMFFGIAVRMYYDDHGPPHFHAYYAGEAVVVIIETFAVRDGRLPRRAMSMVLEWAADHRQELLENWRLAGEHRPLNHVAPLE